MSEKRLLIVVHSETNRMILATQARSWGMQPVAVASGMEALDLFRQQPGFDMAILDMQMPEMSGLLLAAEIREVEAGTRIPLIMLSSLGRKSFDVDNGENHFAAFLGKPIKSSQLFDVVVGVVTGERTESRRPSVSHRIDRPASETLALRILLAEDNVVNQKVAMRMLEKLGYRADLARNGLEVMDALRRQRYDVVLMDVHMPEMDGLEASRQIRQQWGEDGPLIIAMTANAMQGDKEECLSAGMNDYISKPVQITALQAALERCRSVVTI